MSRSNQTRRQLMKRALATAGVSIAGAYLSACASTPVSARRIEFQPFALGVASGDPVSDGFVIWTRLTPHGPISEVVAEALDVVWEVATDEMMSHPVRFGAGIARARTCRPRGIERPAVGASLLVSLPPSNGRCQPNRAGMDGAGAWIGGQPLPLCVCILPALRARLFHAL